MAEKTAIPDPLPWTEEFERSVAASDSMRERQARRRRAVINATAGIPTKALEAGIVEMLIGAAKLYLAYIELGEAGPDYGKLTQDTHPESERIWSEWWDRHERLWEDTELACRAALNTLKGDLRAASLEDELRAAEDALGMRKDEGPGAIMTSVAAYPRHFELRDRVRVTLPSRTTAEGIVIGITYAYPAFDVAFADGSIMHDVGAERLQKMEEAHVP